MKCSDFQDKVSQFVDGCLSAADSALLDEHLEVCPLCRQKTDDFRSLKMDLRMMARPAMPAEMAARIRSAVRDDVRAKRHSSISPSTWGWIQMKVMPLSVGITASVVIGLSFLTLLLSGGLARNDYSARNGSVDSRIMISNSTTANEEAGSNDISPVEYARNRMAISEESPSINPQGTLAALSNTLSRHGIRNDEVVVVADVFSNGLARIAEVVEPSQNIRAVDELERALDSDLANTPFVPASMDNRSNNVRVVLKFQSVEVNSRKSSKRR